VTRVRVIGVGSGFGDDAAALAVIDWLEQRTEARGVSLRRCARPLPDLLDALDGAEAAVVIDAARSADPPGFVRAIAEDSIDAPEAMSSHGFGTRRVVMLARSLDRAPARLVWIGIAIGGVRRDETLSDAVRAAIPVAGELALESARRLATIAAEASSDA